MPRSVFWLGQRLSTKRPDLRVQILKDAVAL